MTYIDYTSADVEWCQKKRSKLVYEDVDVICRIQVFFQGKKNSARNTSCL